MIKKTVWFYLQSRDYMKGHSNIEFFWRLPKAYIKFMWLTYTNTDKAMRRPTYTYISNRRR